MKKIDIPESVRPGFLILLSLKKDEINILASYLEKIHFGISAREMVEDLQSTYGLKSATELVRTVTSFSELLEEENVKYSDVADRLALSYNELSEGALSDFEIDSLKNNLITIFGSYKNLLSNLKARDLIQENDNNFHASKIVTDLRIVFNKDLENKKRHGIIIHRLHIEYRREKKINEIYLSLDMDDLKQLREGIDRAIKKEEVIKNDYNDILGFA